MNYSTIELFKNFSPEEIEKFSSILQRLDLKEGEILFNAGDPGDSLYIVYEGGVRIFIVIDRESGAEKSLALLEAGSYLGEMTLMDGAPRSASARAALDSVILKISRKDFIKLLHSYPQSAIRLFVSFLQVVSGRLRRTNEELVVLYDVGKIISECSDPAKMMSSVLKSVVNSTKANLGIAFLVNEFTGQIEVKDVVGEIPEEIKKLKFNSGEGIVGISLAENKTLKIDDIETDERMSGVRKFGFERKSILVVPLTMRDKPFGSIYLAERQDGQPFDNANINLLTAVASQAASAIEGALFHKDREARDNFDRKFFQF